MTYPQTIEYLYEQLPMFTRIGAVAYKKDLHNTLALLQSIGNPHRAFKSVHIAGTNGKGSSSHMLAALFTAHGYKTGLYTSPHLVDFRERIKVNTDKHAPLCMVPEDFVVSFTQKMMPVIENIRPSFFELTVAMAFEWFALQQVDIAIVETGLGGRLDSTNVLDPILSLITNIGWDHMNILGNSLQEIAAEKAGIIKQGIPVVISETLRETKPVFIETAGRLNAPIIFAEEEITILNAHSDEQKLTLTYLENGREKNIETDLPGLYQQFNLRGVLAAIEPLRQAGFSFMDSIIKEALLQVRSLTGLQGRWENVLQNPRVYLDVGHNEDGIRQILNQVEKLSIPVDKIHFAFGMVRDKEVDKILQMLPRKFQYYFTNAKLPRALPATELQQKAAQYQLQGKAYADVNQAVSAALSNCTNNDLLIVCGSVFVVGEVNRELFMP